MSNSYNGVKVHEGLSGLRHERAMYIGGTGLVSKHHAPRGLTQLIQEIISNSVDEFVVGYGSKISVTIHEDNAVTITDFGRGIPKGPGPSFSQVVNSSTKPHASGKFDSTSYDQNGVTGLHGIGVKATNAVSKYLTIKAISASSVEKDGVLKRTGGFEEYEITFHLEEIVSKSILREWKKKDIEPIETVNGEITKFKDLKTGEVIQRGTTVSFLPDDGPVSEDDKQPVFESIEWVNSDLYKRFEMSAFLNPGLEIVFVDERETEFDLETQTERFLTKVWVYPNGIEDYVKELASEKQTLPGLTKPMVMKKEITIQDHTFGFQGSVMFTEDIVPNVFSYANGVLTSEGGPHEDGFNSAVTKSINDFAKDKELNKVKKGRKTIELPSFTQSEVLEGMVAVFEIRVPSDIISFEGQTKEKLGTALARQAVYDLVYEEFTNWLYDNESKAQKVIEKVIESKTAKDAAVKARSEAKKARATKGANALEVSSKLKAASSKDPTKKEIYITEGDSASNIKRDTRYQAIMPLRGKIKNVNDLSLTEVLKNDEISTITSVLGTGIGPAFELSDLQYNMIILAADADADGDHIKSLLITLFFKYFRPLIENGHVYIAIPPLYRATKYVKGKPTYKTFYSESEMDKNRQKLLDDGYSIRRFKGLGEMNPQEVGDAIANKETRVLKQLTIDDAEKVEKDLKILMGNNAALRKAWIAANIDFDKLYEDGL